MGVLLLLLLLCHVSVDGLPLSLDVTIDGSSSQNGFSLAQFSKPPSWVNPTLLIREYSPTSPSPQCMYSLSLCRNLAGVVLSNNNVTSLLPSQNGCHVIVSNRIIQSNGNYTVATNAFQSGAFFFNVLISPVAGCGITLVQLDDVCDLNGFGNQCSTLGGYVADGTIVAPGQIVQWTYVMPQVGTFGSLVANFTVRDYNATGNGTVTSSVTLNGQADVINATPDMVWSSSTLPGVVSFKYLHAARKATYVFQLRNDRDVPIVVIRPNVALEQCANQAGEGPLCAWVSPLVFFDETIPNFRVDLDPFCVGQSCSFTVFSSPSVGGAVLEMYVNSSQYTIAWDWDRLPFPSQLSTSVTTDGWYVSGLSNNRYQPGLCLLMVTFAPGVSVVNIPIRFSKQGTVLTTAPAGGGGLTAGQIAGIVIGVLVGLGIALFVAIYLFRKRRQREYNRF